MPVMVQTGALNEDRGFLPGDGGQDRGGSAGRCRTLNEDRGFLPGDGPGRPIDHDGAVHRSTKTGDSSPVMGQL